MYNKAAVTSDVRGMRDDTPQSITICFNCVIRRDFGRVVNEIRADKENSIYSMNAKKRVDKRGLCGHGVGWD